MFTVHDLETAPAASRPFLENANKAYGMIPNLYGVFAEDPGTLEAYEGVAAGFANTSLTAAEQQVVLLTVSVENECGYCVAAHSTISAGGGLFGDEVLTPLRAGQPLPDPRLEALRSFTSAVLANEGHVPEAQVEAFIEAGFTRAQVLAVVTGVAMKTLSNYVNHLADTPLDGPFQALAWDSEAAAV